MFKGGLRAQEVHQDIHTDSWGRDEAARNVTAE